MGNAGDNRRGIKIRTWGKKSENNFINCNKQKCGKTRRELNGAMPYNNIGLLY